MFSQYFGHYLLNHELITREQLADVLDFQQAVHVKFGVIAVDEGFMTPSQVEQVHNTQKQVDKRFGEIALDLGFLTTDQVETLVHAQKQGHLLLAQALIDRGYMTIEQYSTALNNYKKDYSLSDDKFEKIKSGNIDVLVENLLERKDSSKQAIFGAYLSLFAKNIIRFIDPQVYLDLPSSDQLHLGKWFVQQEIVGETPLFTAISADDEVFLHIASIYAEEELTEVDELAKAAVSEFLNLHNGIYLVNKSNDGIELNMKPQEVFEETTCDGELFIVAVHTSKGPFHLILSDEPANIVVG